MASIDSIGNIVRVMDFHALARIDKARSTAQKTRLTEALLEKTIRQISYNKNLNIDKKLLVSNKDGVDLNIYIGSDLSFCGDFNSTILAELMNDKSDAKIVVGQKIYNAANENFLYAISKEDFYRDASRISQIIDELLSDNRIRSVNVIYNKYYSIDDIRLEKEQIFPVNLPETEGDNYDVDYVIEHDANRILCNVMAVYLNFKVKIAETSSWAAENVNREKIARESLKRIDDLKEEKRLEENQKKRYEELSTQIENFKRLQWRQA